MLLQTPNYLFTWAVETCEQVKILLCLEPDFNVVPQGSKEAMLTTAPPRLTGISGLTILKQERG